MGKSLFCSIQDIIMGGCLESRLQCKYCNETLVLQQILKIDKNGNYRYEIRQTALTWKS